MALPSESAIREALSRVQDPELHRSLTELEMVREVEIGDEGAVSILIALTVPGCPLKAKIEGDITAELRQVEGVTGVLVAFTHMTEEERAALGAGCAAVGRRWRRSRERKGLAIDNRTRVIAVASARAGSASRR